MSDWYYAKGNAQEGPINESELKNKFAAKELPPESLVWTDGMADWVPANSLPNFTFRAPPIPAKKSGLIAPAAPVAEPIPPVAPAPGPTVTHAPVTTTTPSDPGAAVSNLPGVKELDKALPVATDEKPLLGFIYPTKEVVPTPEDVAKNKFMGILAYVGYICCIIPGLIPFFAAKESPFAQYHARQGLMLIGVFLPIAIAVNVFTAILSLASPTLGQLFSLVGMLVGLVELVLMVMGVINAASGVCKQLPVIGKYSFFKNQLGSQ